MPDLLLLCRHAKRDDEAQLAAATEGAADLAELAAVVDRLLDALAHDQVRVTAIRHAPTSIAAAHARWIQARLARHAASTGLSMKADCRLDPASFMRWRGPRLADRLVGRLVHLLRDPRVADAGSARAVLVVGHMPQLGWLAARLMGNRSPWTRIADGYVPPVALKNGEVAAIAIAGTRRKRAKGHLEWTVAPDESQAIDDLRDKIKSKMEVAKLLGGFMTLVLGGILLSPARLDELSRGGDRWAVYTAAVAFLIAIGLYLRTMYAYDTLLMPRRYWGEGAPGARSPRWLVRRPPSSAAWILYQNMLHVWTFLFTPATLAVVVGLLALSYAALDPCWLEGIAASLVLVAFAIYGLRRRPRLGSQD
jgi:hypothetical protein